MKTIQKITLLTAGLLASVASWADGTAAGTPVKNTATATYYAPGSTEQLDTESNEEVFYVQELIKVSVTASNNSPTEVEPGATNQVMSYTITNTGNGNEVYKVTAADSTTGNTLDLTAANIHVFYEDGTAGYQGVESALGADGLINLTPGQSITVLVVVDIPATAVDGDIAITELTVVSQTAGAANAALGTVLPAVGDNGTDAVVGLAGGTSTTTHTYNVVSTAYLTVEKNAVNQADPFGGSSIVPGTVTTYQITVTVNDPLEKLVIVDPLPAEVTYVSGSMLKASGTATGLLDSTNATALTDVSTDTDGAKYESGIDGRGRVTVDLGDQTAAGIFTIQFEVTIN